MNSPSARGAGNRVPRSAWQLGPALIPLRKRRTTARRRAKPTEKWYDPIVLRWIHQHKLIYPWLLQRRFPTWMSSSSTTYRNLQRLEQLRLVKPIVVRGAGRDFPNVCQVTGRGVQLVTSELERSGVAIPEPLITDSWKQRGLSAGTVLHDLCTAEVTVYLEQLVAAHPEVSPCLLERRFNRAGKRLTFTYQGRRRAAVPDAGQLLRRQRGGPLFDAVEVDLGSESGSGDWADKLNRYRQWYRLAGRQYLKRLQKDYAAGTGRCEFRLLIVAHEPLNPNGDGRRLALIFAQALQLSARWRRRIWLTTGADLQQHIYGDPADAKIWYRVDTADDWVHDFHDFRRGLEDSNHSAIKENDFVRERLASLPRLQLLDPPAFSS